MRQNHKKWKNPILNVLIMQLQPKKIPAIHKNLNMDVSNLEMCFTCMA